MVHCDVLILGAGPAGLSAAIYAARAKMNTIVVDEGIAGGQVATTFNVANYPGTNGVIRGTDLVGNMTRQALDFGSRIDDMKEIQKLELTGEEKHVTSEDTDYFVKCIIIATGAAPRKLPAEGERDFRGRGVHYCAACDGAMYQDADLLVAGGGNSAVEEAVFLTRYAKHVTVIHQLDHFQASKTAQDELFKNPGISVIWNSEIRRVFGDSFLKGAVVEDLKTGQQREINADGVFVYIGMQPRTDLFKGLLDLDEKGYIICDEDMNTSAAGVFAAGDVRVKRIRQIATAANDGVIAGLMAEKYINKRGN
ncbi:MAG: thioredoxin-disulfide reductase [Bacillota bacterium]|nr:thioredoxin-disulfide reductase [Bacillota bacterium]